MSLDARFPEPPIIGRRSWRRLERRARAAHEKELLHAIAALAEQNPRVESVDFSCTPGNLNTVRITLSNRVILLAAGRSKSPHWDAPTDLVGAGRYRGCWWLTLESRSARVTLTGSHLLLVASDGKGHGTTDPHRPLALQA
jgi:hypothetical protein